MSSSWLSVGVVVVVVVVVFGGGQWPLGGVQRLWDGGLPPLAGGAASSAAMDDGTAIERVAISRHRLSSRPHSAHVGYLGIQVGETPHGAAAIGGRKAKTLSL